MRRKSISEVLNNKQGAALVTVLVVFLTLVVIVMSATMMAQSNFQRAQKTANFSSAYYVAESGLNETIDDFKAYYETLSTPKSGLEIELEFKNSISMEDDTKRIEYGNVMNQEAWADTAFSYEGTDGDIMLFRLASNGHLGDTSRSVETFIRLRVATDPTDGTEGTYYQPDAVVVLDPSSNPTGMSLDSFPSITGPLVTNKPLNIIKGTPTVYKGPIVTNNVITINKAIDTKTHKSVFITSSNVNFNDNESFGMHALVLKGDAKIKSTKTWSKVTIDYLLIPSSRKNENVIEDKHLLDTNNNGGTIVANNIIYYDQLNFDPFTAILLNDKGQVIQNQLIFGEDPNTEGSTISYDYRDYFKADFVLDNPDNYAQYIPTVVLPERPTYEQYLPNGNPIVEEWIVKATQTWASDYTVVDKNNNYAINPAETFPSPINIIKDYSKETKRSYNSLKLNGGDYDGATKQIYIGDNDITIVTKSLELTGFLEIVGTGSLRIYVIGDGTNITSSNLKIEPISIKTRDTVSGAYTNDSTKLQVVVYKTDNGAGKGLTATMKGWEGTSINMSLFSDNLNLKVNHLFNGTFVSAYGTEVTLSQYMQNTSQLFFAPNATITIPGSGTYKGVLVGKEVIFGGNGSLVFDSQFDKSLVETILPEFITVDSGTGGDSGGSTPGTPGSPGSVGEFTISPIREVDK